VGLEDIELSKGLEALEDIELSKGLDVLCDVELGNGFEVDADVDLGKDVELLNDIDPKLAIDSIGLFFDEVPCCETSWNCISLSRLTSGVFSFNPCSPSATLLPPPSSP
jgi:hypothetical protein